MAVTDLRRTCFVDKNLFKMSHGILILHKLADIL
jgi:hypothetical protein